MQREKRKPIMPGPGLFLVLLVCLWKGFPGGTGVKNPAAKAGDSGDSTWVQPLGWGDPLEEGMAAHSLGPQL